FLVTGVAGFIGAHVVRDLLARGHRVIGVDNLNDYYDVELKRARLNHFTDAGDFQFHLCDIADHDALIKLPNVSGCDCIIHLAAQAGVRYSLENPFAYASSNLVGHLSILELARRSDKNPHLVYASSSSVYGANTKTPFCESDPVTAPVSLYAATKRSDELMSEAYHRLYDIPQVGLRFFTVYGPWGRPDMAYWSFAERIIRGEKIRIFNNGDMMRDFTYIDDIVSGVVATALSPVKERDGSRHRIYNIGNNKPEKLMDFVVALETAIGKEAVKEFAPMQPGDVVATYADIDAIKEDYGFQPTTPLADGIPKFIDWYRQYLKC
ncbi:MAG: GDP-mannose 4,6-dehydratase, partial [Marinicaulis sp.]|nr:GDP-mannose 4,6-dehydratase [Marinicaulis sp.]